MLLYHALTFPLSLLSNSEMLLHPVIPMCSVTSSPESLYAWVWLTSLNILWPKKLLGWDFMEYKSHYTLKKTLRILSVNKMYDFLDAWILGHLFYLLILFPCPSISYAYVWWEEGKVGCLWRDDIAFFSWLHSNCWDHEVFREGTWYSNNF